MRSSHVLIIRNKVKVARQRSLLQRNGPSVLLPPSRPRWRAAPKTRRRRPQGLAMKLIRRRFLHLAAGAVALPAVSRIAHGETYPSRPVRLVVPFAPAGPNDIIARVLGQWLSERLGQPFVIENRPGAATNVGTETVVNATPDGYTVLIVSSPHAINATLYEKLHFNFMRDIAPVAGIAARTECDGRCSSVSGSNLFPNSSAMPKPIRANSISRLRASGRQTTCPGSCSRS